MMSYHIKFRLTVAAFMSLFMASIMSGCIMATRLSPLNKEFYNVWLDAFLFAWPIAFPVAFFVAPIALKLATKILPPPTEI